jgi:hypothetical protein
MAAPEKSTGAGLAGSKMGKQKFLVDGRGKLL